MESQEIVEKIKYYQDEADILEKRDIECKQEQEKLEHELEVMSSRTYGVTAVTSVLIIVLLWYGWIEWNLTGRLEFLKKDGYIFFVVFSLFLVVLTVFLFYHKNRQECVQEYFRRGDLFSRESLALRIDKIKKQRMELQGKRDVAKNYQMIFTEKLHRQEENPWERYESTLNRTLSEEEKKELIESLQETKNYNMQNQLDMQLFDVRAQIRFLQAKRQGILDKDHWVKTLMRIEMSAFFILLFITIFIFPITITGYQVVDRVFYLLPRFHFLLALLIIFLLYVATCVKHIHCGKGPISKLFRRIKGVKPVEKMLEEIDERQKELEKEEKKLLFQYSLLLEGELEIL